MHVGLPCWLKYTTRHLSLHYNTIVHNVSESTSQLTLGDYWYFTHVYVFCNIVLHCQIHSNWCNHEVGFLVGNLRIPLRDYINTKYNRETAISVRDYEKALHIHSNSPHLHVCMHAWLDACTPGYISPVTWCSLCGDIHRHRWATSPFVDSSDGRRISSAGTQVVESVWGDSTEQIQVLWSMTRHTVKGELQTETIQHIILYNKYIIRIKV